MRADMRTTVAEVVKYLAGACGVEVLARDGMVVFADPARDLLRVNFRTRPATGRITIDPKVLELASAGRATEYIDEQMGIAAARARGALLLAEIDCGLRFDFATDDGHAAEHIERAAVRLGEMSTQLMALLEKARTR